MILQDYFRPKVGGPIFRSILKKNTKTSYFDTNLGLSRDQEFFQNQVSSVILKYCVLQLCKKYEDPYSDSSVIDGQTDIPHYIGPPLYESNKNSLHFS